MNRPAPPAPRSQLTQLPRPTRYGKPSAATPGRAPLGYVKLALAWGAGCEQPQCLYVANAYLSRENPRRSPRKQHADRAKGRLTSHEGPPLRNKKALRVLIELRAFSGA